MGQDHTKCKDHNNSSNAPPMHHGDRRGLVVHCSTWDAATFPCELQGDMLHSGRSDTPSGELYDVLVYFTRGSAGTSGVPTAGLCDKAAVRHAACTGAGCDTGGMDGAFDVGLMLLRDCSVDECLRVASGSGCVVSLRELLSLPGELRVNVHMDGADAFRWACASGNLDTVRELLSLTGDRRVDVHCGEHEAAFRVACAHGRVDVVRELLSLTGDRRVNVHACEDVALRSACARGHLCVVRELLALAGDRTMDTHMYCEAAFRGACGYGRMAVVRELLSLTGDRRVDIHARNGAAFAAACESGCLQLVRELLSLTGDRRVDVHASKEAALTQACKKGHLPVVHELLALDGDRRVDVHARDEAAFAAACSAGQLHVMHALLALRGDRTLDVHAGEERAFVGACRAGQLQAVRELLRVAPGIDVHAQGCAALESALEQFDLVLCAEVLTAAPLPPAAVHTIAVFTFDQSPIHPALSDLNLKQMFETWPHALQRNASLAMQVAHQTLLCAIKVGQVKYSGTRDGGKKLCLHFFLLHARVTAFERATVMRLLLGSKHHTHATVDGCDVLCSPWHDVVVPYTAVRGQVDDPRLRAALWRPGRGAVVLHRADRGRARGGDRDAGN